MIKIDKGNISMGGDVNTLISELAIALHAVITKVEKEINTRFSYDEILEKVISGIQPYRLIDAGMDPKEALEVTGLSESYNLDKSDLYPEQKEK